MPALINTIIPKSGWEICRDAIGAILLIELTNQKQLQGASFPEDIDGQIMLESLLPADSANQVTINILPDSGDYTDHTQSQATGMYRYFIDIYTSGTSSLDSSRRRDKFLSMCTYIFNSAFYRTLGLSAPQGLIGGVYTYKFQVTDPIKKEDSDYTSFARLQLQVKVQEVAGVWDGVQLNINNTSVKLENSDKGYIFVFDNQQQ